MVLMQQLKEAVVSSQEVRRIYQGSQGRETQEVQG